MKAANETAPPDARRPVQPAVRLPAGLVPLLSAIATVSVAAALSAGYRGFDPVALAVVTAGALAAIAAAVLGSRRSPGASAAGVVAAAERVLGIALVAFALSHVFVPPGIYVTPPQPLAFRALAVAATVVALTYVWRPPPRIARWRFPALVALFVAMAVVVVQASPFPFIDVWWLQQYAASLIWRGDNPYTFLYQNVYG